MRGHVWKVFEQVFGDMFQTVVGGFGDVFGKVSGSFLEVKNNALLYGIVNTFNGFIVMNSYEVDVKEFTTIIIWCEPFSEFITAAKYQ